MAIQIVFDIISMMIVNLSLIYVQ